MRLGNEKSKNPVFHFSLRSPFTIFALMKRTTAILHVAAALCMACLFSCGDGMDREAEIAAIDSIADTDAPRALALLDSMKPRMAGATEAEWSLYSLMRVKAEDKAYIVHKTDTVMLRLIDYYEEDGDKRRLPQVYYYAGRVYADMYDNDRALPYFQKVVEMADSSRTLYYKAQAQMGYIFLYQGLYEKGFNAFSKSYKYNKTRGNKSNQAYALCGMANCLQRMNGYKQAMQYLKQALILVRENGDKSYEADILGQIANNYYYLKQYRIAEKYAQQALAGVDSTTARPIYAIAADIYNKVGKEDSAVILYNKLYALDDVYAKYSASKRLGHYYLEHKNMAKAAIFLDEYDRYTDSIQEITLTETVAKIDAVYNYNIREEENERLKEEITTDRFIITVAAVLVIAAILAVLAFMQYSKKKRLAERIKYENEKRYLNSLYEQSSKFISDNNSKIEALKQELAASASKNMSLAAALKAKEKQLSNLNMMAEIRTKNRELAAAGLENSDIRTKIFTLLNDNTTVDFGKKLTAEDWQLLDEEVNSHYPEFKERISALCRISDIEYRVCLLLKVGVSPKDIATLTIKTKSAISVMRKRLYTKAFGNNATPEMWDEFIRSL
jgi:tetratricopeptide (TPR) repeat protein